jgi:hypothetical protein
MPACSLFVSRSISSLRAASTGKGCARGGRSAEMNAAGAVLGNGGRAGLDRFHGMQYPDMSGWDDAQGIGRDVAVGVVQDELAMQSGRLSVVTGVSGRVWLLHLNISLENRR